MSGLETDVTVKKKPEDDILVLAVTRTMANTDETEQEHEGWANYEEPTEQQTPNLYLP